MRSKEDCRKRSRSSPKSLANLPSVLAHSSCLREGGNGRIDARGGNGKRKKGTAGRRENLFEYLGLVLAFIAAACIPARLCFGFAGERIRLGDMFRGSLLRDARCKENTARRSSSLPLIRAPRQRERSRNRRVVRRFSH
ncbi:hypothetical protein PUN28_014958 [Cardiocondyla obscurior]|uniref:Transmembrane protein n=1 Tax=Cardiocondyla obscurior TaxID=286306 RepID=A0AAW2EZQ5_9HYME